MFVSAWREACCIGLALTLAGCASNPYKTFYQLPSGGWPLPDSVVLLTQGEETEAVRVDVVDDDLAATWRSNHYVLVGASRFLAPLQSEMMVIACGTSHGATHATYATTYVRTDRDVVPVDRVTPTTRTYSGTISTPEGETEFSGSVTDTHVTTWMMPYNVEIYRHDALFWVQLARTPPLGVIVRSLTPTETTTFGRNTGVVVDVVLKETPAFFENILIGDLIVGIDASPVASPSALRTLLEERRGDAVTVHLERDGEQHAIKVPLAD